MTTALILDCDTGIDDALAIFYGAHHGADFVCALSPMATSRWSAAAEIL